MSRQPGDEIARYSRTRGAIAPLPYARDHPCLYAAQAGRCRRIGRMPTTPCRLHLTLLQEGAGEREADGGVRPSRQTRVLGDDVSAALEWAFSPRGDTTVGIALTIAAIPLWIRTSSLQECRRRVQQAIASLGEATTSESRNEL